MQTKIPHLHVKADDNFGSSVTLRGSFDAKETWSNGIFQNSRYFIMQIHPKERYYAPGMPVISEVIASSHKLPKYRKYTGSVEKVLEKIEAWFKTNK